MSHAFKWQVIKSIVEQWDKTRLWGYFYRYGHETKIRFLCSKCMTADLTRASANIRESSDHMFGVWLKDGYVPDHCERC